MGNSSPLSFRNCLILRKRCLSSWAALAHLANLDAEGPGSFEQTALRFLTSGSRAGRVKEQRSRSEFLQLDEATRQEILFRLVTGAGGSGREAVGRRK
jgi:hypothetical protein